MKGSAREHPERKRRWLAVPARLLLLGAASLAASCGDDDSYRPHWLAAMIARGRAADVQGYYEQLPRAARERAELRRIALYAELMAAGVHPLSLVELLASAAARPARIVPSLRPALEALPPALAERLLARAEQLARPGDASDLHMAASATRIVAALSLVLREPLGDETARRFLAALRYASAPGDARAVKILYHYGTIVAAARRILRAIPTAGRSPREAVATWIRATSRAH